MVQSSLRTREEWNCTPPFFNALSVEGLAVILTDVVHAAWFSDLLKELTSDTKVVEVSISLGVFTGGSQYVHYYCIFRVELYTLPSPYLIHDICKYYRDAERSLFLIYSLQLL